MLCEVDVMEYPRDYSREKGVLSSWAEGGVLDFDIRRFVIDY